MPDLAIDKVEVYVFRRRSGRAQFLALRRGRRKTLPGIWQPVTGKLEPRETPIDAALRELREETGLVPLTLWRLEVTTLCLESTGRRLMALPLFAAEVSPTAAVRLSNEHVESRFMSAAAARRLYLWDSQRKGLDAIERQILPGGALARALELDVRPTRSARSARSRTTSTTPRARR
ncbi:MAG: NUDIX domain-containing protein [Candidatus Eisenbacteria bacterium]|uniref:NUDIX domain-containing protein n=1 Tax=Eiseniibacteriota bacterium TaxID=2212470 RepID=A0A538U468_UNCEI|nr:MAG: NUDIX domain-containing protein [Candidatus Eisenbacteria bacterium]